MMILCMHACMHAIIALPYGSDDGDKALVHENAGKVTQILPI